MKALLVNCVSVNTNKENVWQHGECPSMRMRVRVCVCETMSVYVCLLLVLRENSIEMSCAYERMLGSEYDK